MELDAALLLHLALGHVCLVYDFGSRNKKRGAPRALWYGLEFIRYALEKMWLDQRGRAYLRGHDAAAAFDSHVRGLSTSTERRLKYYRQYIPDGGLPEGVRLYGVYSATAHDMDFGFYRDIAIAFLSPGASVEECIAAKQAGESAAAGLVARGDTHAAAEELLGMRLFLGGLSHKEYCAWRDGGTNGMAEVP